MNRDGTRFSILLHAEMNRLAYRIMQPHDDIVERVREAVGVSAATLRAWMSNPAWARALRESSEMQALPRCPNPECGCPASHKHPCKSSLSFEDIARGAIERHLGDEDLSSPDSIYDAAFTLAHDALIEAGLDPREASAIAAEQAGAIAQP